MTSDSPTSKPPDETPPEQTSTPEGPNAGPAPEEPGPAPVEPRVRRSVDTLVVLLVAVLLIGGALAWYYYARTAGKRIAVIADGKYSRLTLFEQEGVDDPMLIDPDKFYLGVRTRADAWIRVAARRADGSLTPVPAKSDASTVELQKQHLLTLGPFQLHREDDAPEITHFLVLGTAGRLTDEAFAQDVQLVGAATDEVDDQRAALAAETWGSVSPVWVPPPSQLLD